MKYAIHCLLAWGLPARALRLCENPSPPDGILPLLRALLARMRLDNPWGSLSVARQAAFAVELLMRRMAEAYLRGGTAKMTSGASPPGTHSASAACGRVEGRAPAGEFAAASHSGDLAAVLPEELEVALLTEAAPVLWEIALQLPPLDKADAPRLQISVQEKARVLLLRLRSMVTEGCRDTLARSLCSALAPPPAVVRGTPPPGLQPAPQSLLLCLGALMASACTEERPGGRSSSVTPGQPTRPHGLEIATPGKGASTPVGPATAGSTERSPLGVAKGSPAASGQLYGVEFACSGVRSWRVAVHLLGVHCFGKAVGQPLLNVSRLRDGGRVHAELVYRVCVSVLACWSAGLSVCQSRPEETAALSDFHAP